MKIGSFVITREHDDPSLWPDDKIIAALERAQRKIYPIYRGWVSATPSQREAAGNIGLCVEGRLRELRGGL